MGVFQSHGLIFWNCTPYETGEYLKAEFKGISDIVINYLLDPDNQGGADGVSLTDTKRSANFVIWLNHAPIGAKDLGTLAHEAAHVAFKIMKHWSIEVCDDTDEVFAMLTGHIVEKTLFDVV